MALSLRGGIIRLDVARMHACIIQTGYTLIDIYLSYLDTYLLN